MKGAAQFLVLAVLVLVVVFPFLRTENPGNTYGIDVSSHNGTVRWDEVSENGVQFAVIRAGGRTYRTGEIYQDTRFKRNMRRAWFHHVDRGVYFYSQAVNTDEAREEAKAVLKSLNIQGLNIIDITMLLQFVVSFGFILPVNSPQGILAFATDTFTAKDCMKVGIPLTVIGYVLLLVFAQTYWKVLGIL